MRLRGERNGVEAAEVVVMTVLFVVVLLIALVNLPRQREVARTVGCQQNLMKLGIVLSLYDQTTGKLPGVDSVGGKPSGPSPIARMLDVLGQPDFVDFESRDKAPARRDGKIPVLRIPGLICPTDPRASTNSFDAPISYRATTGDSPDGRNGAFAPGWVGSLKDIEAKDGTGYTAGFSERLLGSGTDGGVTLENYALVPGPLTAGKPSEPAPKSWKGDAGSDWRVTGWTSTLYNHALVPGSPDSRVSADGKSALMGASSDHEDGVYVLFLDGSVKTVTRTVDPAVWRGQATRDDGR